MAPLPLGLTRARPRLGASERVVGSAAASWTAKGLSRQASRMTIGDPRLALDVAQEIGERQRAVDAPRARSRRGYRREGCSSPARAGRRGRRRTAPRHPRSSAPSRSRRRSRAGPPVSRRKPGKTVKPSRVSNSVTAARRSRCWAARVRLLISRVADHKCDLVLGGGGGCEEEKKSAGRVKKRDASRVHRDPSGLATTSNALRVANDAQSYQFPRRLQMWRKRRR